MNWLDILLILALLLGGLLGVRSGLLWQVARIVIFLAAIYACIHHHEYARNWLAKHFSGLSDGTAWLAAYALTFLAVCLAGFLVTWVLEYFLRAAQLKPIDRILGGVVGLLKAALLCGALLTGVVLYGSEQTRRTVGESHLAPPLLDAMQVVLSAVPDKIKHDLAEGIEHVKKHGAANLPRPADGGKDDEGSGPSGSALPR